MTKICYFQLNMLLNEIKYFNRICIILMWNIKNRIIKSLDKMKFSGILMILKWILNNINTVIAGFRTVIPRVVLQS